MFANPGFAPVLAQAVGTPVIVVYGGNESHKTTNRVGEHLAPTLPIEIIIPVDDFSRFKECNKSIDIASAKARIKEFMQPAKTLIFCTTHISSAHKARLLQHWVELTRTLNPACDLLIVDSASPVRSLVGDDWHQYSRGVVAKLAVHSFSDNIGHLSHNGRDGWGRAVMFGLQAAIDNGYEYVVHIEGDSLLRRPVLPIVQQMRRDKTVALIPPVQGTRRKEVGWVETGLMFFETKFLRESKFVERYDWPNRKQWPTPEKVIFGLLGINLKHPSWRAERGDKSQITAANVSDFDWITHCWGDDKVYDAFVASVLGSKQTPTQGDGKLRLNLGCGANFLRGWQNYDRNLDITKPLPFATNSVDCIFTEHCIEHIDYYKALDFFRECHRVLRQGGVLRVTVPSVEEIMRLATPAYCDFAHRLQAPSPDVRGAMHAILYGYGHKAPWTDDLLRASLFFCGFDQIEKAELHRSKHADLHDVEGHHRVIGKAFNAIESITYEATKC